MAACGPHELTQTIGNLLLQAVEDTADLTQGTGSYRAQAVLTVADVLNNNAPPQRYSRQTWEAALPALLQAAERGQLVGELMHPPGGQSDQARQCLRYRNLRWTETTHPQQGRVPALQGEVEIIPTDKYDFFDYEAKYLPGASHEICPARLDPETTRRAQECALTAHQALGCRGYSRTDMIIREQNIYVLETNTIPGMTATSLFPQGAKAAGIEFPDLLDTLITLAREK